MTDKQVDDRKTVEEAAKALDPIPTKDMEAQLQPVFPVQTKRMIIAVYGVLVLLGVGTGYLLSRTTGAMISGDKPGIIKTGKVAGISDTKTFKDSAEGTIEKGGLGSEGTHKLIRDGGPSQTVYLISSAVDLDEYAGKKVKVWGQTMAAKKAAWLMDVGKVELQ